MVRSLSLLVAAVLLLGVLTGCFMPLFDLETSLAYQTASKMTKIATVGPIGEFSRDRISPNSEYYYLPSRSAPPDHGLLIVEDDLGISFHYFAPDPSDPELRIKKYVSETRLFDNSDPSTFGYEVGPIDATGALRTDAYFIATSLGDGEVQLETWAFNSALPAFESEDSDTIATITGITPPFTTLAVALDVNSTAGTAPIAILVEDSSPSVIDVYSGNINNAFLPGPAPDPPIVNTPTSAFPEGYRGTGGSAAWEADVPVFYYSNYDSGGSFDSFRWDSAAVPERLPSRQTIDAILATGELYHRGANSDEIYDGSGRRKYSIPTGKLHFAYELTIASVPTMFYTLVYFDEVGDNDDDNMYIDIYSIPTEDLEELD